VRWDMRVDASQSLRQLFDDLLFTQLDHLPSVPVRRSGRTRNRRSQVYV
jgi:hypothetical protein